MEREQMIGKQSILFHNAVHILSGASMVGKKEGDGPLGKYFDKIGEEDGLFGCQSWEEAESILQKEAVSMAIKKVGLSKEEIRMIYAGDLLAQTIASSFGIIGFEIPVYGLYGACATMGEALSLASMAVAGGYGDYVVAVTSSHFGSAEKEFRFPLGYGNQRPFSATWTVTGSGAWPKRRKSKNYRNYNRENHRLRLKGFFEYGSLYGTGCERYHLSESGGFWTKTGGLRPHYYR